MGIEPKASCVAGTALYGWIICLVHEIILNTNLKGPNSLKLTHDRDMPLLVLKKYWDLPESQMYLLTFSINF